MSELTFPVDARRKGDLCLPVLLSAKRILPPSDGPPHWDKVIGNRLSRMNTNRSALSLIRHSKRTDAVASRMNLFLLVF